MFGSSKELKKLRKENEELKKYEEVAKKYATFRWGMISFEKREFDTNITIDELLQKFIIMESLAKVFSPTIREDVERIFKELKK